MTVSNPITEQEFRTIFSTFDTAERKLTRSIPDGEIITRQCYEQILYTLAVYCCQGYTLQGGHPSQREIDLLTRLKSKLPQRLVDEAGTEMNTEHNDI